MTGLPFIVNTTFSFLCNRFCIITGWDASYLAFSPFVYHNLPIWDYMMVSADKNPQSQRRFKVEWTELACDV